MFGQITDDITWSIIFGVSFTILVHFIYYWYLFENGDKKY
jgi:hypothetical protein